MEKENRITSGTAEKESRLTAALHPEDRILISRAADGHRTASITVSEFIAQCRGMLAPEYSEQGQAVPGEFWTNMRGEKKQVYVRTFRGEFPAGVPQGEPYILVPLTDGVEDFSVVHGYAELLKEPANWNHADYVLLTARDCMLRVYHGSLCFSLYPGTPDYVWGRPFMFTLKYTKA